MYIADEKKKPLWAALTGAPIGCLGGLIGLGGAEYRLPVLVGLFGYPVRSAVPLNLAVSLVTLVSSMVFRFPNTPFSRLAEISPIILSLILGGIGGAYFGVHYSRKLSEVMLEKIILALLMSIGLLLIGESLFPFAEGGVGMSFPVMMFMGAIFGAAIGVISSMLGVAGGELIIPTLILLFGVDPKLAGSASIIISLPTVITGLLRHRSHGAFSNSQDISEVVVPMGIGSVIGSFAGGMLVYYVSGGFLKLFLGLVLIVSAVRIYRKERKS